MRADREQLKWFLFAAVPLTVLGSASGVDKIVGNLTTDFMFHRCTCAFKWALGARPLP